jgi:cytochrome c-type biogenesis protein CcmH/NrfG
VGAVVAVLGVLAVIGNPITYAHDKLDEFRSLQSTNTGQTRLTSLGGQRYDVWRIALREFKDHPIGGVGLGSYGFGYYAQRKTDRNLSDPHGLPFKLLSETGIVGFGLFLVFLAAIGAAAIRARDRVSPRARRQGGALAAAGVAVLVQASVDWIWTIPGVMALAFVCLAIYMALMRPDGPAEPQRERPAVLRRWIPAAAAACAALLVLAVYAGDFFVRQARADRTPSERLSDARTAGALNPWSTDPLFLEASSLEDQAKLAAARAKLEDTRRMEPDNFVPIALLGDFEARRGNVRLALAYYRQALAMNPRDVGLQQLAAGAFAK